MTSLLTACSRQTGISVINAWIPEAPPTVQALAGYMEIENHYPDPVMLIGAESPDFQYIEIHHSTRDTEQALTRMVQQKQVSILSGQVFKFQPGEHHLMLMHPKQQFSINQSVPVTLTFNNGLQLETKFTIRKHTLKLEADSWF